MNWNLPEREVLRRELYEKVRVRTIAQEFFVLPLISMLKRGNIIDGKFKVSSYKQLKMHVYKRPYFFRKLKLEF